MSQGTKPLIVATVGAAYTANKGAGSMLQALFDGLEDAVGRPIRFDVHSTYPVADTDALAGLANVVVVDANPKRHALLDAPLAALAALLRVLHLPDKWLLRTPALASFAEADIVVDVTGISFSDDRKPVFVVYHALLDLVPMLLDVPVVKASQAMGPFSSRLNRTLGLAILRRLDAVCARGAGTAALLAAESVDHVAAADLAFLMETPDTAKERAQTLLAEVGVEGPYVAVLPSSVVWQRSTTTGVDYPRQMADVITHLIDTTDRAVVVAPHSAGWSAPGSEPVPTRLDDRQICREVKALLPDSDRIAWIDTDVLPSELRALIAGADLAITSRFHAMVSALSVATPPVVVGWSHKYGEVLASFGLEHLATDEASTVPLTDRVDEALATLEEISATIRSSFPEVERSSRANFDQIVNILNGVPA